MAADTASHQPTNREKVFMADDCLSGPSSVVEAMASGKKVAISVSGSLTPLTKAVQGTKGFFKQAKKENKKMKTVLRERS